MKLQTLKLKDYNKNEKKSITRYTCLIVVSQDFESSNLAIFRISEDRKTCKQSEATLYKKKQKDV